MNDRFLELQRIKETDEAKVCLCLDLTKGQKRIVKELSPRAPEILRSAQRMEAVVLQKLTGPGFPKLCDSSLASPEPWIALEFIEGERLDQWLANRPGKALKKQVFLEILQLIGKVHQSGFLYLDLKADNVLISGNHPVLIDFNACLPIGSRRPVLSNQDALPPEGKLGKEMDERADQVGLGGLYAAMFHSGTISRMASAPDPQKRFRNLEAFEKAAAGNPQRKRIRILSGLLAGALSVSLVSVFGFAGAIQSGRFSSEKLAALPDRAADIVLAIERKAIAEDDLLHSSWFFAASQSAINDQNRVLAGYLQRQITSQLEEQNGLYVCWNVILSTFLSIPYEYEKLARAIEIIGRQTQADELYLILLDLLTLRQIVLDKPEIEKLCLHFETLTTLSDEACESFLRYVLFCMTRSSLEIELEETLAKRCEFIKPQIFELYLAQLESLQMRKEGG